MVFTSHVFLLFMLVFLPAWAILRGRARQVWLLLCSLGFYGWWDVRYLPLLLLSTVIDWMAGAYVADPRRSWRRLVVGLSVLANLGVLATFKYLGWATDEVNKGLYWIGQSWRIPEIELIVPVGLSFYTFQSMAYTIDVYRGRTEPAKSFIDFATFVSFFPQLVAGPIERSASLLPQIERGPAPNHEARISGFWLVLIGFFKKLFVADNLAVVVERIFDDPTGNTHGFFGLWVGGWAFTWQIYCDFSGYSDIARGLARLLGYELRLNFDQPLLASSPQDLWRRWHISLSSWLRDYLYIPLGGNRKGLVRTQINLLLTMLIGGLWHGASWTFVLWGAWHGLGLALDRGIRGPHVGEPSGLRRWLSVGLTFQFTALGFVIFRCRDLSQVQAMFSNLLRPAPFDWETWVAIWQLGALLVPIGALELWQWWRKDLEPYLILPAVFQIGLGFLILLSIVVLGASYGRTFVYFQF